MVDYPFFGDHYSKRIHLLIFLLYHWLGISMGNYNAYLASISNTQ